MPPTILIAYYTRTVNTHTIAEAIQRPAGGTLAEMRPVVPCPPSYQAVLKQARTEIKANGRPAIESVAENPGAYGTLFIGSPVWWRTLAPPVAAFLATHHSAGRVIAPFYSHGGGGAGHAESDLAQLCPDAIVKPALTVPGNGGPALAAQITAWLARIGVVKV